MSRILVDPGHGGNKPGAGFDPDTTIAGDELKESEITLQVALSCGKMLREKGHDVLFTRDRDINISLSERRDMINEFKPDAFISIHCNATKNHLAKGVETFYRDAVDFPLASTIQHYLAAMTGLKDRGIFQDFEQLKKHLAVLDNSENTPATLVELGFIDNDEDRAYLTKNMATVAEILADAINEWACGQPIA